MKRKRFLAVLTAASLSASMALTAMPVFAADVVSVEASDANTVTNPVVDANTDTDTQTIVDELKAAKVTTGASTEKTDGWTIAEGTTYKFGVDSVSDITFKMKDDGTDIEKAEVTLTVSVMKESDNTGAGTATVVVDLLESDSDKLDASALKYTAAQKVAAAKLYAEAQLKNANAATETADQFNAKDNRLTIQKKLKLDSTSLLGKKVNGIAFTGGASAADGDVSDVSITYATGTVKNPTSSETGSIPITLTYKATTKKSENGSLVDHDTTDTSSLTGVIPTTKAQNDTDYESKIEAAIEAGTWTSDDFNAAGDQLSNAGKTKLVNLIKAVDDNTNAAYSEPATNGVYSTFAGFAPSVTGAAGSYTLSGTVGNVNVGRYTAGTHGKDGAASISFYASRKDGAGNKVDSFSVKLKIVEGDSHVQSELADAFTKGVKTASTSLKQTPVDSQDAAVKVITDAIDAELARTYNGKAYKDDIESYEIVVPDKKFTLSTADDKGSIEFYIKVNTGRTSAADPTVKDTWFFTDNAAEDAAFDSNKAIEKSSTATDDKTAASDLTKIDQLAKLDKVAATSISLPSTISYNVTTSGKSTDADTAKNDTVAGIALKDYIKFTPEKATTWTIRWTNSNTAGYALVGKDNAGTNNVAATLTTNKANRLPTLKLLKDAASTVITADLLDSDGNVIASAKTTVTAVKGFDDVQNKSYFAYNAINALSNTIKREDDADAGVKTYNVNGRTYSPLSVAAGKKISSSPVAGGTGNNKFDPYADVTRAQFVTFLYRNACNEYTFIGSAYDKDPASYDGTTKFSDVAADKYYAKAVAWAVDNGIVNGKTDTTFAPDAKITRAEAVTMIYRLQANGASFSSRQSFTDVDTNAYYADAVGYASYAGITNGKTNSTFAPNDNVTRGEAATFIYRAVDGDDGFYYSPVEVTP